RIQQLRPVARRDKDALPIWTEIDWPQRLLTEPHLHQSRAVAQQEADADAVYPLRIGMAAVEVQCFHQPWQGAEGVALIEPLGAAADIHSHEVASVFLLLCYRHLLLLQRVSPLPPSRGCVPQGGPALLIRPSLRSLGATARRN